MTISSVPMSPERIEAKFTRSDGSYCFARWGRPIVPVIFGIQEQTLEVFKGAIEAIVSLAGHNIAETDPELGANLMIFFMADWAELLDTPKLGEMIPDLPNLVSRLQTADANQYRSFRFDDDGAIQACFVFLRMDKVLADLPADSLALAQMAQVILLWSEQAFARVSPLGLLADGKTTVLKPTIAQLIQAAYDPIMPVSADDPSHALRLYARVAMST